MSKFVVSREQRNMVNSLMRQISLQLQMTDGSAIDPEVVRRTLESILADQCTVPTAYNEFLFLIKAEASFVLSSSNSCEKIESATRVFQGIIDAKFASVQILSLRKSASADFQIEAYSQRKDANFLKVFESFERDLQELCWNEDHIIEICRYHRSLLHPHGMGSFFLVCNNEGYRVVDVRIRGNGILDVHLHHHEDIRTWSARNQHRYIIPGVIKT